MDLIVFGIIIFVVGVLIGKSLPSSSTIAAEAKIVFEEPPIASEVKIGHQTWMTRNLDVDCFRNGDTIPEARSAEEWNKAGEKKQPAWCFYDKRESNGKIYGKLYNWYAVIDPRGLAPAGWHIPTEREWSQLIDLSGGIYYAGGSLKSKFGWVDGRGGTNAYGFTGLPAGCRLHNFDDGGFSDIGRFGFWWSSSEACVQLTFGGRHEDFDGRRVQINYYDLESGFSVRCLRD